MSARSIEGIVSTSVVVYIIGSAAHEIFLIVYTNQSGRMGRVSHGEIGFSQGGSYGCRLGTIGASVKRVELTMI